MTKAFGEVDALVVTANRATNLSEKRDVLMNAAMKYWKLGARAASDALKKQAIDLELSISAESLEK